MKNNSTSIKKNIAYQMLYEFLSIILPLILSPYISRTLGAENLGIYSYISSIATYFGLIAMLGVKNHGNREIAKCRGVAILINRTFSNIYFIQFTMSCVMLFAYCIFIFYCKSNQLIYSIQLIYLFYCLLDISWFFFGIEKFKITVIWNSVIKIVNFIAIILFINTQSDLLKYCIIMTFSTLLNQLFLWLYFFKYAKLVKPNRKEIINHIKPMIILFIPVLAVSLYNVMDKIMVGGISTKTQLGYYENAEKMINCIKTVLTSFGTVMMPRMSRLAAEHETEKSTRYMNLSFELIMLLAIAFAFGISSIAKPFAIIYWGDTFAPCGILLIGLSISLPFSAFANIVRTQYLIPHNMDNYYIIAVTMGALINVSINALLIPNYGAVGAVIGTVIAESIVCFIQCLFIYHKIPLKQYMTKLLLFLFFGVIMQTTITIVNTFATLNILFLCYDILIGVCIYTLLSITYFVLTKNELFYNVLHILKVHMINHKNNEKPGEKR